jgi:hypothetical protein
MYFLVAVDDGSLVAMASPTALRTGLRFSSLSGRYIRPL